ncbi:hypothetical protein TRFO_10714 [Tritrichomonas foetus]|uniref:Apple domain-containing protein n=1 Tax=Tritrichomonas foetus TaxID=1144522 RepID=A0A1J4JCL0_9EUKA|nr:hypothetical protein TRFO_10714 [Tritrichomonas foetus]|eukprot:OHS95012.1 hypothetical protein TRFO_10714 [Tritrichomonas foetus]
MLNSTIVGLSAILLASNPFSLAQTTGRRMFNVDRSIFSKSLHNVFYFNTFLGSAKFSKATFDNIIGGAIKVESYDAKDQVIEKRFSPNIMSQNYYSFESCMFRKCFTTGEKSNGGAISINVNPGIDYDVDLSLEFSSFYNCYVAGGQGGAIYGFRIGDVDIKETCFQQCTTREKSETEDTGSGTACYIWHRANTERCRLRGSSFDRCPETGVMNPNTETVFFVLMGRADSDDCNFTNNFIEKVASAIAFTEQHSCDVDFTSFINCSGECTIFLSGQTDANCDINTVNFVNCASHPDTKNPAIILGYATVVTLEKCVFIMGTDKYLAARSETDTTSKFTFSDCIFDRKQNDLVDTTICNFNSCNFDVSSPETNKFTFFDSRECWEIEPDRLPASNTVYAFLLFFALFGAIVGFGLYLQLTQVLGGNTVISENYDAAPAVSEPINKASYDAIPE